MEIINKIKVEFPARLPNAALARGIISALVAEADITVSELDELKVVVSEAVTNSIIHAYPETEQGLIEITASLEKEAINMVIQDWGQGIEDLDKALEAEYTTRSERMGLGFSLMQAFCSHLEVESALGQGTKVSLRKSLTSRSS